MKKIIFSLAFMLALGSVFAQSKIEKVTCTYAVKDGQELFLDKYVDNTVPYEGKRPVLIYVHGGGFSTGSRINALQIKYCKHFVAQGFVSVAINYRLGAKDNKDLKSKDTLLNVVSLAYNDLIDATAFVLSKAKEWNIDPSKILISGGSAGAITCLTTEYELCSGADVVKRLPEGFNYAGIISHAGAVIAPNDTIIWKKKPCPMLLMHGSKDQLVPFEKSVFPGMIWAGSNYIHKQLTELNIPHWLYEEVGADHIVAMKPLQYNFGEIDTFVSNLVMKGQKSIIHTKWADEKADSMNDMFKVVPLFMTGWDKTDEEVEMEVKNGKK